LEKQRIAKVLARMGVASRRECERLIADRRITVNGALVTHPATLVGPDDSLALDGRWLAAREPVRLWRYHKPAGLLTTARDPQGRPTIFAHLPKNLPRVISVGRLDYDTEGLLLLTNDGGLSRVLELPETGWLRRYRVRAFGEVTQADLDKLAEGIVIDGVKYGPVVADLERSKGMYSWATVTLKEGKNREVKRLMEHLGLRVARLIRVQYGPFHLGHLPEGGVEEVPAKIWREQLGIGRKKR
jgi:23S rRNA pseudouridine2605 synthase